MGTFCAVAGVPVVGKPALLTGCALLAEEIAITGPFAVKVERACVGAVLRSEDWCKVVDATDTETLCAGVVKGIDLVSLAGERFNAHASKAGVCIGPVICEGDAQEVNLAASETLAQLFITLPDPKDPVSGSSSCESQAARSYGGTITTTGTHSSFGFHAGQPEPFTCVWNSTETWIGTVNLANPDSQWEVTSVNTFASSDSPIGARCGGFTVGPYQAGIFLQINGNQVTADISEAWGTITFNATATDTSLNGTLSTTGMGSGTDGGHFEAQGTGTFNLPKVQ